MKIKIKILEDLSPDCLKGSVVEADEQPAKGLISRGKADYASEKDVIKVIKAPKKEVKPTE